MQTHDILDSGFFENFVSSARLVSSGEIDLIMHAYIDESGTHDGANVMAMAGYILSSKQVNRFNIEWTKNLRRNGLPFAHMTDLAHGNGIYNDMERPERIQQGVLLIDLIKRRSKFGFAVAIDKRFYEKSVSNIDGLPSAYSFCVMSCMLHIKDWITAHPQTSKMEYIFEAGHQHASEAQMILNNIAKQPNLRQTYRHSLHTFALKNEAIPLQAADMLAWQVHHFHERCITGHKTPRQDYLSLIRPVDKCHLHNVDDLAIFNTLAVDAGLIS